MNLNKNKNFIKNKKNKKIYNLYFWEKYKYNLYKHADKNACITI